MEVTKSPHTAAAYVFDVKDLERFLGKRRKFLLTATGKDLGEYLEDARSRLSVNSLARRVSGIKRFYRFAMRAELMTYDPSRLLVARTKRPAPRSLPSVERIFALLEAPPATTLNGLRDRAIFELLYGAGLRRSELSAMNLDSVDFRERILRVMGKGGRERLCPINRHALDVLQAYLDRRFEVAKKKPWLQGKALLMSQWGKRINSNTVLGLVKRYAGAAGLSSSISPHTLRHCFATHLMKAGAKIEDVKLLLGHHQLRTTQRYVHVELEDLQRVYRKTHPRALSSPQARNSAPCGTARCDELLEAPREKRARVRALAPTWVATPCQEAAI